MGCHSEPIETDEHTGLSPVIRGAQMRAAGSFCPFGVHAPSADMDQNFMVTQWEVQSTVEGVGGRGGAEEHVRGRVWVDCLDLVVGEAPCTQGFLLLGVGVPRQQQGRRDVSVHAARWPAELRQQKQQSVSRGQLQDCQGGQSPENRHSETLWGSTGGGGYSQSLF